MIAHTHTQKKNHKKTPLVGFQLPFRRYLQGKTSVHNPCAWSNNVVKLEITGRYCLIAN